MHLGEKGEKELRTKEKELQDTKYELTWLIHEHKLDTLCLVLKSKGEEAFGRDWNPTPANGNKAWGSMLKPHGVQSPCGLSTPRRAD